ncbi:STM3941 family protein [Dictyobacter alpinus]|uniref:STM3941 family protein n=1 Tax=Dictyobacter alpinus TaxID=2014873 RepID=UPI000F847C2F|nr:STM3941 family protein [Dictyobacter alpinus]
MPQYPWAMPGQEIIVYPNRAQAIGRTIISGIALVAALMLLIVYILFILVIGTTHSINYIFPILLYLVLMLPLIVFVSWATWNMAQLFLNPTPLLIINRQGITTGKTPTLSGFFIPWHEIEAIHTSTFLYKYLCIRPKDPKQFLQRFSLLERLNRQSNTLFGIPPLIIPQVFLDRSAAEILYQMQFTHARELYEHHIRLYP